jgi:hypothetical protein
MRRVGFAFVFVACLFVLATATAPATVGPLATLPVADSAPPHLKAVITKLEQTSPGSYGSVWWYSTGNTLPSDWLLPTPNCWGQTSCSEPPPGGKKITDTITAMVARARRIVDYGGLYVLHSGGPDGLFRDALIKGLVQAYKSGSHPLLRMMIGEYPVPIPTPAYPYANALRDAIYAACGGLTGPCKRASIRIQLAYMDTDVHRYHADNTWDHEKVLDVDGTDALVGGMNYFSSDYLKTKDPVSDLTMRVQGPAANDALAFDDTLWAWRCSSSTASVVLFGQSDCVTQSASKPTTTGGSGVPILTVGRLGAIPVPGEAGAESPPITPSPVDGNNCRGEELTGARTWTNFSRSYEYANPGEDALRALVASATKSIFLSQQDLLGCSTPFWPGITHGFEPYFDERLIEALGVKIAQHVPMKIVVSAGGPRSSGHRESGPESFDPHGDYTNGFPLGDLAQVLTKMVAAQQKISYGQARGLVCSDVALSQEHNGPAVTWSDGVSFGQHTKLVEVDGEAFYIGSENLYPARLQELGYIVEDAGATNTLMSSYLEQMWKWSAPYALIDPSTGRCGSFTGQTFDRQLSVVKLRGTNKVEIQWADLGPNSTYTHPERAGTDVSTQTASDGVWQVFGSHGLGFIQLRNTGSNNVEVKLFGRPVPGGDFKQFKSLNSTIRVADAANGVWQLLSYANGFPELAHIKLADTANGKVAVQWFAAQNGVYRPAGTATTDFSVAVAADGVWQLVGASIRELAFIQLRGTHSGAVEVHWDAMKNGVFERLGDATSDLDARDCASRAPCELFPSNDSVAHFAPDIALIELDGIPNGKVAVKWLTWQSGRYADAADDSSNIQTMTPGSAVWQLGALRITPPPLALVFSIFPRTTS